MPIWCSFFRLWTDECVQVDAVTRCGRDAGVLEAGRGQSRRKTQASWRQDTGALEAGRGQSRRKMQASWRQDACRHLGGRMQASWRQDTGALEAGRGQSRRKTQASWRQDAGILEAGRRRLGGRTRASWRQDAGSVDTRRGQSGRNSLFLGSTVLLKITKTPISHPNWYILAPFNWLFAMA